MPLQPQTTDVQLSTLDQNSPTTSGPLGKLGRLINAQVTKFQSARTSDATTAVRVEKRDAFFTLSDIVRSASDGSVQMGATIDNQSLLTEFDGRLILVSNDKTHVYSNTTAAWEKHDYQLPTNSLTQEFIHTSNSLATTPDIATAEGVYCYTWVTTSAYNTGGGIPVELPGCYFRIVDSDGVVLRADSRVNPTDTRIKCVSDGGYFWIFSEVGDGSSDFSVRLVDRHGLDLASTTFAAVYSNGDYWDITSTSFGILHAQGNHTSHGVEFTNLTYDSGSNTITRTTITDTSILGYHNIAFLTNDLDQYAYLATSEVIVPNNNTIHAYRITSSLVSDHHYVVSTSEIDQPINITGYVVPGTSSNIVVAWSIIDPTGDQYLKNTISINYVPFSGSPTFVTNILSMNLASRAFKLGNSFYAVGYYPSNLAIVTSSEELPNQPTYFLLPLYNPTQRVAGRFEYQSAYCDWQKPNSKYNFALASVVDIFPGPGKRTALSYRAESFTSERLQVNGDIRERVQTQATTVGVKAFTFGTPGQAVSLANEILLPGPGASSWSGGEFSESGINLAFEQPALEPFTVSGSITPLTPGTYQYVVVAEWTDNNGNRVRSRPSPVATIQIAAVDQFVSVSGFMQHTTNKKDVLISIYRTDMVPDSGGGYITTTLRYKITVDAPTPDESPLYNNSDSYPTWQYSDSKTHITNNEILYTDKGQLENYPAPPFSKGTVWKDRIFVVSYDNSIWFSAEPTEGDALWFHPAFRITLPTTDTITAVANLDEYLLVLCENSLWYVPSVTLPDSSGANGSIPSAVKLPFKQGCTGQTVVTRDGCYYSSSANGLWLITRNQDNVWAGEPAAVALDAPISAMAIDNKQRIYCVIATSIIVYDTIVRAFYEWSPPGNGPLFIDIFEGVPCYADGTLVWKQNPGSYIDSQFYNGVETEIPYFSLATINFLHLGGVKNYKRIWEVMFSGQTYTNSTITVDVMYDDNTTVVESKSFTTDSTKPFLYSLKPKQQLCSSIGFTITESLTGTQEAGKGFALEMISLSLGLEPKGLARIPINKRF